MKHAWGYATDQRLREENQDNHGVFEFDGFTLAVVCDGMGGHVGGAEASAIAVRTIFETMTELQGRPVGASLQRAILRANEEIYNASRKYRKFMGMGTTVVAVAVEDNLAHIAHVGDSRLYVVRGGQAHLLTRDHTMVNLFVEAELLSPEDAAAHPEAHVLARSLGVEPTVEVDLQEPLELEPGDVLLLCSDGVHGPLDDTELGAADWSTLPGACDQLVQHVRDEEGDDNATVVAVGLDLPDSPAVPPTPPPPPVDLELKSREGETAEEAKRRERNEPKAPMLYDEAQQLPDVEVPPAPAPTSEEAGDLPEVDVEPLEEVEIGVDGATTVGGGAASADVLAQEQQRRQRRTIALVGGGLGGTLLVVGLATVLALYANGDGRGAPIDAREAEIDILTPVDVQRAGDGSADANLPGADTGVPAAARPPEMLPEGLPLFAPQMPEPVRRVGHRARQFVRPAPGGTLQTEIVKATRDRRCGDALATTLRAMSDSIDYGSLYDDAWDCTIQAHTDVLASARADTVEEVQALEPHFRGRPPLGSHPYPEWYQPPTDGIELVLQSYLQSSEQDLFVEAMHDLRGEEAVADELTRLVVLEAEAAAGLSRIQNPSPEVQQLWARRLFWGIRSMEGRVGEAIEAHRPEEAERIREQLSFASKDAWPDGDTERLPQAVQEAILVGSGEKPVPEILRSVAARPRPRPKPQPEPEPEDLTPKVIRVGP